MVGTLNLSDLAGPDADGWSDVAVFVRADGSESDPFVVQQFEGGLRLVRVQFTEPDWERAASTRLVRRLGRGRLVPARIEMEGETAGADLAEQVRMLRAVVVKAAVPLEGLNASVQWELAPVIKRLICETCKEIRAAIAATAPEGETK